MRALVVCLGKGMAERMGGLMAVVTVEEKGTWIGEVLSSSSDSCRLSLGLLVGCCWACVWV